MTTEPNKPPDRRDHHTTETLRLRALSPALTVDDVEASLAWYRDVIGFHVQETWEQEGKVGGAALIAGLGPLFLVQDDYAKGRDREKGVGVRIHMTTSLDVNDLAASIEERGGTLDSPPEDMPWGARAFSLVDPDGYKITIASER